VERLFFEHALLPNGWAQNVRVEIGDGKIAAVSAGAPPDGAERIAGVAVPGIANLHCHAFQRGMAGLAERGMPGVDDFWTWREVMYGFVATLTPEDVEAITAFAYMEMLEAGFASVAEFHYLHHAADGTPYADRGEMAGRVAAAAAETGIGLTLLPSFYAHGDFGGADLLPHQRRFANGLDRFLALLERCRTLLGTLPDAVLGIAPHSLRAVAPEELLALLAAVPHGVVHIHAAEQAKEVEGCLAWSGRRPVEWLMERAAVDRRWCLIHATHMTLAETAALARSGAVAGLCPLTEADLGDGIFPARDYLAMGGRFGVGSDSNVATDPAAELRQLEYAQRLSRRGRNVLAPEPGGSVGRRLFEAALEGGAQATGQPGGAIAPGRRGDIVVLDLDHPDLVARSGDAWLDGWIFVAGRAAVRSVFAGGRAVVTEGRHARRDAIAARYRAAMARLAGAM
jgi:formimidoylglutamate deiminase